MFLIETFYYFKCCFFIIFIEIPDFLSTVECEHIIKLAGKKGLFESVTMPDSEGDPGENVIPAKTHPGQRHLVLKRSSLNILYQRWLR